MLFVPACFRRALALLPAAIALLVLAVAAPSASAAGSPNLGVSVDGGGDVLHGEQATIRIQASSPAGEPQGYNLTYRAVLPAGVSFVAGSSSGGVTPVSIANQPALGQTTLIWSNVSDIAPNSSQGLTFRVDHDPVAYPINATFTILGEAYAQTDPRLVPRYSRATGAMIPGSFTGFGTSSAAVRVTAVEIEKSEPSPESELLRGVHDQQTTYRLEYRNNGIQPTTGVSIDDYLPAGLEFLGCGGATSTDHTTDAPTNPGSAQEYPGSGPINVTAATNCIEPVLVETVLADPFGTGNAVYTHVRWQIPNLPVDGTGVLEYAAAIPIRANTLTWSGGAAPSILTGAQATNLDNNSGAESSDEAALRNSATISGQYGGTLAVSDTTSHTVSAEDLRIVKSASASSLAQGAITTWTLRLATSEYRWADAITVTDTVPDGFCPLGPVNYANAPDAQDAACAPTGNLPSIPYTTVNENADGTYTITWDPVAIGSLTSNDTLVLTFPTRTRTHYQENFQNTTPVLANDGAQNTVALTGTAHTICVGGATEQDCTPPGALIASDFPPTQPVIDASQAGQQATQPALVKRVAQTSANCTTATYVSTVPSYRPGDRVCWELRIDYPSNLDTGGLTADDFVPVYDTHNPNLGGPGVGELVGPDNTILGAAFDNSSAVPGPGGSMFWTMPSGIVQPSQIFHRYVASTVGLPLAATETPLDDGFIASNLFKATVRNTAGVSTSLRDQADYALSVPELAITKRIVALNGTPITPTQNQAVNGGDTVRFAVTVSNTGSLAAEDVEIWDNLPTQTPCASVSAISDSGSCAGSQLTWGSGPSVGPTVPAATGPATPGTYTVTYDVAIPDDSFEPGETAINNVGIRKFESPTNQGPNFLYYPDNNIDPAAEVLANVPQALDSATLTGQALTQVKNRTSPTDGANNGTAQAAVGETVTYTVDVTLGREMALDGAVISDPTLDYVTRFPIVGAPAGSYAIGAGAQGPLPGGFSVALLGGVPTLTFPASYTSGAQTETFRLSFDVRVADVAANVANGTFANTGRIVYDNPNAPGTLTRTTNSVTTRIVEPLIGVAKSNNSGGPVNGNQVVTYTLALTNGPGSASPISRAHDTVVVDQIPAGLTPVNFATELALADGDATGGANPGVWNATLRTITWDGSVTDPLEPGGSQNLLYKVRVNNPPVGGASATNTVDVTTTSRPGTPAGERIGVAGTPSRYWDRDTNQLIAQTASLTKSASPANATIGTPVTYTVDVTIPSNVDLFDVTVIDTLPANIDFDSYVSETCTSGCPPNVTSQRYTPVTGASTQTVAWDFGDLAAQPAARVVRLVYTGHVRATVRGTGTNVVAGNTSVNSARVFSNETNALVFNPAAIPPAAGFDEGSTPATASVTVREPAPTMSKEVRVNAAGPWSAGPVNVEDGDTLEYRIVVTNSSANWPLYDVTVEDQPDVELTGVTLAAGDSTTFSTDGWTAGDRDMRWLIPGPIAPGASVTLSYTANLIAVTSLSNGQLIDNTASVPSSYGVPSLDRAANPSWTFRSYTTPNDSTQAVFRSPQLTLTKTTGAAGFPETAPAEVGQPFTWRIVAANTSTLAGATNLEVIDTLPPDWDYVPGSASFSAGGPIEPTVTPNAAGDVLTWSTNLPLVPAPAANATRVLTFQAIPQPGAAAFGTGAGNPHVNSVVANVDNDAGNPADAGGAFAAGPDTAAGILAIPALTISKTPDGGSLPAGAPAPFSILVTNTGTVPARGVDITDTMPAGTTYTAGTATATFANPAAPAPSFTETDGSGPSLAWTVGRLEPGQSVAIALTLATDPAAAAGTALSNGSGVSSDELPTPVTDPGDYTLTNLANVIATKSATPNPATAGTGLDYTIGVSNAGPSVARSVVLTDTLPLTVELDPGATLPGACSYVSATRLLTCTVGNLNPAPGAGSSASFVIETIVVVGATGNASNTVTATTTTPESSTLDNEATVVVPIGSTYDLSITKTTLDTPILNGQTGRFRLRVGNSGPSTATAVVVTDVLPAQLDYVSDDGGCSYTLATRTVSCPVGAVDPGDTPEIVLTVRANAVGTWNNAASVASPSGTESNPGNNTADDDIVVLPATDLRIEKTAPATVAAGDTLSYALEITNDGPSDATGVQLVDTLPPGTVFVSADAGCTAVAQSVTCLVGALASGASETRQITVRVPIGLAASQLTNTVTVSGAEGDPTPANNTDDAVTQVGPAADLAVVKSGPAQIDMGANIAWTVVVTNNGPSTATGVQISDQLPAGTTLISAQPSQGTCGASGAPLVCELGTIAVGGSAQVLISAATDRSLSGTSITNPVTVTGAEPDVDLTNNSSQAMTQITTIPFDSADLVVTKRAEGTPTIGRPLSYAITVLNRGPAESPNTRVTDTLVAGLEFQSATTSQGTCAHASGVVTCQLGTLAVGQTVTIRLTVIPFVFGTIPNTATATGDRSDPVPSDNGDVAQVQVQRTPTRLSIRKRLVQPRLKAGASASYKVTVRNTGSVTAINVRTCDDLPKELSLRSRGGGRIIGGQLCWDIARLEPGRSRTYTVKVRVSRTARSSRVTNRASARADNASRRRGRVSSPLQRVAPVTTSGLTG